MRTNHVPWVSLLFARDRRNHTRRDDRILVSRSFFWCLATNARIQPVVGASQLFRPVSHCRNVERWSGLTEKIRYKYRVSTTPSAKSKARAAAAAAAAAHTALRRPHGTAQHSATLYSTAPPHCTAQRRIVAARYSGGSHMPDSEGVGWQVYVAQYLGRNERVVFDAHGIKVVVQQVSCRPWIPTVWGA